MTIVLGIYLLGVIINAIIFITTPYNNKSHNHSFFDILWYTGIFLLVLSSSWLVSVQLMTLRKELEEND